MWAAGHLQWKHCLVRVDCTGTLVLFHGALVLAQVCQPIRLLPMRAMLVCFLVVLSHTSIHSLFFLPLFSWQRTPNMLESGTFVKMAQMPSGTAAAKGFADFHRLAWLVANTEFTQGRSWGNLLTTAAQGNLTYLDNLNFKLKVNALLKSFVHVHGLIALLCVHPGYILCTSLTPTRGTEINGQHNILCCVYQAACLKHAASCALFLSHPHSVKKRCGAAGKINTPCLQQCLLVVMWRRHQIHSCLWGSSSGPWVRACGLQAEANTLP